MSNVDEGELIMHDQELITKAIDLLLGMSPQGRRKALVWFKNVILIAEDKEKREAYERDLRERELLK